MGRRSTRRLRIWHGRPEPGEDRGGPDKPEAHRAAGEAGCDAKRSEHRWEVHRENPEEELESVNSGATCMVNEAACTETEHDEYEHKQNPRICARRLTSGTWGVRTGG
mmetsp:Transcript_132681/g.424661  ORF Transcript_132681/g.424661 Transcript_132681/m.424661 type:complete len:108 (-) Transcript_132681:164-487(-)